MSKPTSPPPKAAPKPQTANPPKPPIIHQGKVEKRDASGGVMTQKRY